MAVKPVNMEQFYGNVGDIYEAVLITAKRARQIHSELKIELNQRLETIQQLTATTETEEELNGASANPDQLKISLEFEHRAKPTEIALQEILENKLDWRYKEVEPKPEVAKEKEAE
jgi:DNA-directed RNA polymerase subunit K/omega